MVPERTKEKDRGMERESKIERYKKTFDVFLCSTFYVRVQSEIG